MRKKLWVAFFVTCFVSLSAFSQGNTVQQPEEKPVFERYSFFSQWTLNLNGGAFTNLGNMSDGFGDGTSYGFGVMLSKPLNHIWQFRLQYIYGDINSTKEFSPDQMFYVPLTRNQKIEFTGSLNELNVNALFSLTDLFGGYNPKRFLGVYLTAGAGLNMVSGKIKNADNTDIVYYEIGEDNDDTYKIQPLATAGLGFKFRLSNDFSINLESSFKFMQNFLTESFLRDQPEFYNYTSLGLTYDLGICKSVKARKDAEKQLTLEQAAAEKEHLEREREECEKAKQNEKRLKEKIDNLEKEMNQRINKELADQKKETEAIKAKMDEIRNSQSTYYALPFSILFNINQHTVPEREMSKLKAIAKVMNETSDVEFMVVGFADYTGSDAYNDQLSKKRAESVVDVLVKKYKVDSKKLKTDSKGKREAFGDIKFDINRRVSFIRVIK